MIEQKETEEAVSLSKTEHNTIKGSCKQFSLLTDDGSYCDTASSVACVVSGIDVEHRHSGQDQVLGGPDGATYRVSHTVLLHVDVVASVGNTEHCVSTCVAGHRYRLVETTSQSRALCVWKMKNIDILNQRSGNIFHTPFPLWHSSVSNPFCQSKVKGPTFFFISRSVSLKKTPVPHQACFFY